MKSICVSNWGGPPKGCASDVDMLGMANPATPIRVRLAPSPTGNLHVGTARTALFNELFARHEGGAFILRIEDTDRTRSQAAYEANILEGLHWLGLTWDEGPDTGGEYGPYRQSERREQHQAAVQRLLDQDKAYIDREANNVIRLRVAPQEVTFTDLIRGTVTMHSDNWGGDFVIARGLDDPLFHLAVVVDDDAQRISHVIRGEDHLSNTARHILLQQALGVPTPQYAHIPLLLDEQRRKLSKRSGETNLLAYRERGYLPETMVNYLALLGWNPGTDQEYFTHQQLIKQFSLDRVQKGGAVFSLDKLNSINQHYLRQLTPSELLALIKPALIAAGVAVTEEPYWQAALATEQARVATLAELAQAVTFFAPDGPEPYPPERLVWRKSDAQRTQELLDQLETYLKELPDGDFTAERLEQCLLAWIDKNELGRGDVLWPLRVALTGREHSPGPFEVASVLGKTATLARLAAARKLLRG